MNPGAIASHNVLLRFSFLLFLWHLINLILNNHVRVNLRLISILAYVFKPKLWIPGVPLPTSGVCGAHIIRVLAFQGREEVVHHDSLCPDEIIEIFLGFLLLCIGHFYLCLHQSLLSVGLCYVRLVTIASLFAGTRWPDTFNPCFGALRSCYGFLILLLFLCTMINMLLLLLDLLHHH
jgi:hypothetical protein